MKKIYSLITLLSACTLMWANPVDPEMAKGKAIRFFRSQGLDVQEARMMPEHTAARSFKGKAVTEGTPAYYVFNAGNQDGYVIVSGDDRTEEILGYCPQGNFSWEEIPENMRAWLNGYAEQVAYLDMGYSAYVSSSQPRPAIEPLISTQWNQMTPYNNQCPLYDGQRTITGCTATAMAQIMNYHQWPKTAPAIPAYSTEHLGLSVEELPGTTFAWESMKDTYSTMETGAEADAVAELMRYCGQALKSDYTPNLTLAFDIVAVDAFYEYFNYDPGIAFFSLNGFCISEWEDIIYAEMSQRRPIMHLGQSLDGGHAFICDGYDGNGMFHFNWGWGGMYDGYFRLTLLNPPTGGAGSGSADGYTADQEIIIGIQPPTGTSATSGMYTINEIGFHQNTIFCSVMNYQHSDINGNMGAALTDQNGNILEILKDCGESKLNTWESQVYFLDLEDEVSLPQGEHNIAFVFKPSGSDEWMRLRPYDRYFTISIDASGNAENILIHPDMKGYLNLTCENKAVKDVKCTATLSVQNEGEEMNRTFYLFASPASATTVETFSSYAVVLLKEGEKADYELSFTPESSEPYRLWVTLSPDGNSPLLSTTIEVAEVPMYPSNLSLVSCVPDPETLEVTANIYNASSDPYYRGVVAYLYENLYNDGLVYRTDAIHLPNTIDALSQETFLFKFRGAKSHNTCLVQLYYYSDHDMTDMVLLHQEYFITGETPVEHIWKEYLPLTSAPLYRLDGTPVSTVAAPQKGIYVSGGKKIVQK